MRISGRFNGPPSSAHGGVACGVFAQTINPRSATVRLISPPPLDLDLTTETSGDTVIINGPDGPVAQVRPATATNIEPLPWLTDTQVSAARRFWVKNVWPEHVFPQCFGCGHPRQDGDGLELYAGTVPGTQFAAACWKPDATLGTNGTISDWAVWGAIDCPSGGAVVPDLSDGATMLLGELTVNIHITPVADGRYQVVARSLGRKGRRLHSAVAIVDEDGHNLATGAATWIEIAQSPTSI